MPSGRSKGGKNKKWTVEEKLKLVKLNVEKHIGQSKIAKKYGISRGQIYTWVSRYLEEGMKGLEPRSGKGNHFSALHTSKSLSREEYLELENAKLKVEIERLKKGYIVKGVGVNKEYVTTKDANIKSSKN